MTQLLYSSLQAYLRIALSVPTDLVRIDEVLTVQEGPLVQHRQVQRATRQDNDTVTETMDGPALR